MQIFFDVLKIIGMVIGGAVILVLVFILILSVLRAEVVFDIDTERIKDKFRIRIVIGPFSFNVLPGKNKKNDRKKSGKEQKTDKSVAKGKSSRSGKGFSITLNDIEGILRDVKNQMIKHLMFYRLFIDISVGGTDADSVALMYGRINAILFPIIGELDSKGRIKESRVRVVPDFMGHATAAVADVRVSLRVYRAIFLLLKIGLKIIKKTR